MKTKDIPGERRLGDGIYDITGIPYLQEWEDNLNRGKDLPERVLDFLSSFPEYTVAHAYRTPVYFFLGRRPEKASETPQSQFRRKGSGFTYGSTNILENCPSCILILAEDD